MGIRGADLESDRAAGIRVFGCVVEQITQALREPDTIATHIERLDRPADAQSVRLVADDRLHRLERVIDDATDLEGFSFELDSVLSNSRYIEQIIHQARQLVGL